MSKFINLARNLALAGILSLACYLPAHAEGAAQKFAAVDFDKLITTTEPGKKLLAPLNDLMKRKQDQATALEQELKSLRDKAAALAKGDNKKQLDSLQREFNDKLEDLRRFQVEANNELESKRRDTLARFHELAMPVVLALGKEGGYAMVFRLQDSGVIYLDPSADLTEQAVNRLNAVKTGKK